MRTRRIACIYIPHLPLQLERQLNPELTFVPVIISGLAWKPEIVLDATEALEVPTYISLHQAKQMVPQARCQLIWDLVAAFDQRDPGRLPLLPEKAHVKPFTRREQLSYEFGMLGGVVDGHLADLRAEDYARLDLTPVPLLNTLKVGTKVRVGGKGNL